MFKKCVHVERKSYLLFLFHLKCCSNIYPAAFLIQSGGCRSMRKERHFVLKQKKRVFKVTVQCLGSNSVSIQYQYLVSVSTQNEELRGKPLLEIIIKVQTT